MKGEWLCTRVLGYNPRPEPLGNRLRFELVGRVGLLLITKELIAGTITIMPFVVGDDVHIITYV